MVPLSRIFDVKYGVNLELNTLKEVPGGIPFVSRTAANNGVSARVARIDGLEPLAAGLLTVAGGGSVLETFLQPEPFYSGRDLYYLEEKTPLTVQQKLYYCACIRANKYRYSYGRQANRTLRDIRVPDIDEIPAWAEEVSIDGYEHLKDPAIKGVVVLPPVKQWRSFKFTDLFEIRKGRRIVKAAIKPGDIPFITAIDNNNGRREFFSGPAIFKGNTITVPYNGNGVAEAFYQPTPYWACDDVNVLEPKFPLTPANGIFLATLIRNEKYRFSYGRKWHKERMERSTLKLPVDRKEMPDWDLMDRYVRTLPFTSQLS